MALRKLFAFVLAFVLLSGGLATVPATAQDSPVPTGTRTVNVELIIDASGSMAEMLPTGESRIDAAKRVLHDVIERLPERDGINVGIRVYGHLGDNTEAGRVSSCRSTELLAPIAAIDKPLLRAQIDAVQPVGWTPIAYALEQAAADFSAGGESITNAIILVTDGEETCDPPEEACAAAAALNAANVAVTTHVVGFSLTAEQSAQLSCIAEEGGGELFDADDAEELAGAIDSVLTDLEVIPREEKPSASVPLDELTTLTHHELTAFDFTIDARGDGAPLLSDDGNTIIFGRVDASGDSETRNVIYALDSDGSGLREIDSYVPLCYCSSMFDASADGDTVVISDSKQIRIASGAGGIGREVVRIQGNEIYGLRISGDGSTIVFKVYRDTMIDAPNGGPVSRGIYALDGDGNNLRRLVGPDEMAPRLNVTPEEVPFFGGSFGVDVSFDASVIIFVSFVQNESFVGQGLFVTGRSGGVPRMLLSRNGFVDNAAVSGDGSTIAFVTQVWPTGVQEVGVIAPNGFGQRHLTDTTRESGIGRSIFSNERMQLTFDGTRLLLGSTGILIDTEAAQLLALGIYDRMHISGDPAPLVGEELIFATMSSDAAHLVYMARNADLVWQLVRLDVNPADLHGAPALSDPFVAEEFAVLSGEPVEASIRAETPNDYLRVGLGSLFNGLHDVNLYAWYAATEGDGNTTPLQIFANCCAQIGPHTLRFRAETIGPDGLRHATTLDVRPFDVRES